tara:strand:+ start:357 stop:626 length:270 start_codon:yes stop_codon:yes gene_type:complete
MNNSTINFLPNDAVKIPNNNNIDNIDNIDNTCNTHSWYKFKNKLKNIGWKPKTPEDYHKFKNIYTENFTNDERKLFFNKPYTFLETYLN